MAGGAYQWEIYNFNNSNADDISSNHKSDITLDHTRAGSNRDSNGRSGSWRFGRTLWDPKCSRELKSATTLWNL